MTLHALARMLVVCAGSLLLCTSAGAQDKAKANAGDKEPTARLCQNEDIVGHVYKMVDFKETPKGPEANWAMMSPYQYIRFFSNYGYASLVTNREILTAKRLDQFLRPISQLEMKYTLAKDGTLALFINGMIDYNYRCVAVLKPWDRYIPGDLIMTGYTRKAKTELYRLFRRWY